MSNALRQKQWKVLSGLLEDALPRSPFQNARLGAAGVALEEVASLDDFTRLMPLTLKTDLAADLAAHPPYGSNHTESKEWYTRFCQTSGTSSQPMAVWDTALSWEWLLENWRLGYALAGVRPGEVAFFAFSFGPFLGFWTAYEAALGMGLRCIPGGGLGTVARLNALVQHRASLLCCTPTYALHLAAAASQAGVDLSRSAVRKILVAGEPGGSLPAVRRQLEAAWPDAEVIDHYGMTEVGPVAFAASGAPGTLQVLGERYFAEVLDSQGRAVEEGGTGELVLTPLGRSSWPLFRYKTGDLVRPRWTAQGLVLEGGILGRADDMVIVRGVNLYPGALEDVVRGIPEIQEYRVQLSGGEGLLQVQVEIEASAVGAGRLLEAAFERAFSLRIPVREVGQGTLPRFELKARRWVRS